MKSGAQAIPKFDPFNMTGLPDHILPQIIDDFYFWYNDYAMRCEFQMLDAYIKKQRAAHTPDPLLKGWLDQGLISESQYDQVALLRGRFVDIDSDIFAKPIGNIPVVPPDRMVPMTAPGSLNRLRHYEEGALDHTIKGGEFLPKVTAFAVGTDGVKRDLRDIDFLGIALGTSEPAPIEGEHLDGEVDRIMQKSGLLGDNGMLDLFKVAALSKRNVPIEGEVVSPVMDLDENLNRRNYGILIRESLDSEGNVEYHLGEPKEKPLEGQIVDKGVLITVLGPEDGAWQAGKEELSQAIENGESVDPEVIKEILEAGSDSALMARIKQRMRPGPKPIDHSSPGFLTLLDDRGLPVSKEEQLEYEQSVLKAQEEELTPEEVADREQAIQEAAEGKLDYLLEGTQWDPKLRK